ncbi:MAG: integrase arm-type DNA-binding domain-containing protein [Micavibrio sp.]
MKLTNIACKNAEPKEKPYKITDGGGVYLYVMPNGSKYWHFKYHYAGKEKRLALGVYPEISLQMAREKRLKARRLLDEGTDPGLEKKRMRYQRVLDANNTFKLIAEEWIEHNLGTWSKNHAGTVRHRLETDIYPKLGNMPMKDINAPMLLPVLRAIEKRGAHEIARRALQYLGQIFRFAIVTGRCEHDVTTALKGALKPFKRGHYAAMDMNELPEFLDILNSNKARLFPQTLIAVKLLMLTFVRTSELIKATWDEFDLENRMWVIPAERMKMGRPHMVPLCDQVIALLRELKDLNPPNRVHIFPSRSNPRNHMSNNTILTAIARMGYRGTHTGHGFRALAMSTIKEKLKYRHEVVDRQLAHAPANQIDKAYDRAKYLDERVVMMQEWANYLDSISNRKGDQ